LTIERTIDPDVVEGAAAAAVVIACCRTITHTARSHAFHTEGGARWSLAYKCQHCTMSTTSQPQQHQQQQERGELDDAAERWRLLQSVAFSRSASTQRARDRLVDALLVTSCLARQQEQQQQQQQQPPSPCHDPEQEQELADLIPVKLAASVRKSVGTVSVFMSLELRATELALQHQPPSTSSIIERVRLLRPFTSLVLEWLDQLQRLARSRATASMSASLLWSSPCLPPLVASLLFSLEHLTTVHKQIQAPRALPHDESNAERTTMPDAIAPEPPSFKDATPASIVALLAALHRHQSRSYRETSPASSTPPPPNANDSRASLDQDTAVFVTSSIERCEAFLELSLRKAYPHELMRALASSLSSSDRAIQARARAIFSRCLTQVNGVAALIRSVMLDSSEAESDPQQATAHIAHLLSTPPRSIDLRHYYQSIGAQLLYALGLSLVTKREAVDAVLVYAS